MCWGAPVNNNGGLPAHQEATQQADFRLPLFPGQRSFYSHDFIGKVLPLEESGNGLAASAHRGARAEAVT